MLSRISCVQLCAPYGLWPTRLLCPWDSPGKNTGVGCHALLHGIFLTQGSNSRLSRLLHWQVGSLPLALPGKPQFKHILGQYWAGVPTSRYRIPNRQEISLLQLFILTETATHNQQGGDPWTLSKTAPNFQKHGRPLIIDPLARPLPLWEEAALKCSPT